MFTNILSIICKPEFFDLTLWFIRNTDSVIQMRKQPSQHLDCSLVGPEKGSYLSRAWTANPQKLRS